MLDCTQTDRYRVVIPHSSTGLQPMAGEQPTSGATKFVIDFFAGLAAKAIATPLTCTFASALILVGYDEFKRLLR